MCRTWYDILYCVREIVKYTAWRGGVIWNDFPIIFFSLSKNIKTLHTLQFFQISNHVQFSTFDVETVDRLYEWEKNKLALNYLYHAWSRPDKCRVQVLRSPDSFIPNNNNICTRMTILFSVHSLAQSLLLGSHLL